MRVPLSGPTNTVEQLQKLLNQHFATRLPAGGLNAKTPLFAGGLGLNSFAVVGLIALVEGHFDIQFNETDFREEHFQNLQSMAHLIDKYRPAPS